MKLTSHDKAWVQFGLGKGFVFTHPLIRETYEQSYVFFRQPLSENLRITMLRPFSTNAWLTCLGFIFAIALAIASTMLYSNKYHLGDLVIDVVHLIIGRHKEKGFKQFIWRKIVTIVVSIFSVIMLSLYTAKVVAVLASSDKIVKAPEDLLKYHYNLSSYSLFHIDRLLPTTDTSRLKVGEVNQMNMFSAIDNVVAVNISDPRKAFFAHPDGFYPQAIFHLKYTQELCLVSRFKSKSKTPRSMYIRKDSPFREKINLILVQRIERGLNFRHQKILKGKFRYRCPIEEGKVSPLSLKHSSFAFMLLLVGSAFALVFIGFNYLCNLVSHKILF